MEKARNHVASQIFSVYLSVTSHRLAYFHKLVCERSLAQSQEISQSGKKYRKNIPDNWQPALHPQVEILNDSDNNFEVYFFPPNVTAFFQNIDQSAIKKMKKIYRKQLLCHLLLATTRG